MQGEVLRFWWGDEKYHQVTALIWIVGLPIQQLLVNRRGDFGGKVLLGSLGTDRVFRGDLKRKHRCALIAGKLHLDA